MEYISIARAGPEGRKLMVPRFFHLPLILLLLCSFGCGTSAKRRSRPDIEWQQLLLATSNPETAGSEKIATLLSHPLPVASPMWPIDTFLRAELYRLRGQSQQAKSEYISLVQWSAADTYKDGWGGSGLSAIAFWRWLQFAVRSPESVSQDELSQMLQCYERFKTKRLIRAMYSSPLLETLPQIEEDSVRALAQLTWNTGQTDAADRFFLDYLQLARSSDRNSNESQIWEHLVNTGQASDDHLRLLLAKRLNELGQNDAASSLLRGIRRSTDADVRAEAEYLLGRLEIVAGIRREFVLKNLTEALDDAANPRLYQEILLERARIYHRPGQGRDDSRFVSDLQRLTSEFPEGSLVYTALYELGRHFQESNDTERALSYFQSIQKMDVERNDRFELSYYQAALALYTRGAPGDFEQARSLLKQLTERRPHGALRPIALFWLGRLAEDLGDNTTSSRYFKQVVSEDPYDYYAIRARMHLHAHAEAKYVVWPDSQINSDLASLNVKAKQEPFSEPSPYAVRLSESLVSKLYSQSLEGSLLIRHKFPTRRIEEITTDELDSVGALTRICLLMALRLDAQAAADLHDSDRFAVANEIGRFSQDWPAAISICSEDSAAVARNPSGFLAAAYPPSFADAFNESGSEYRVAPELLYAVVRRESYFFPEALSPIGALGLFQFTAPTFEDLDKKWKLLAHSGIATREEFLLDPQRNIDLGARSFSAELLPRNRNNIVGALVEHNAGRQPAKDWTAKLQRRKKLDDVEYALESIPYMETRRFARGVLADAYLVKAMQVLGKR